jgi:outer membrane protein OmpA-like peptidoglycan-associated protein
MKIYKNKILFVAIAFQLLTISVCAQQQRSKYSVKPVGFNTENAEFSPAYFNQELIFVTDADGGKKDPDTKRGFYDLKTNSSSEKITNLLDKINTKYHEGQISFSSDGNWAFFTRNSFFQKEKRFADGKIMPLQIFYVNYQNGVWSEEYDFPVNSTEYSTGHPAISPDGKTLYFACNRPGGLGGTDIYRIDFANGVWGNPENLGNSVNSISDDMFPFVGDDNKLYFSSNRENGIGGLDIYSSEIKGKTYSNAVIFESPINTESDDFAFILIPGSGKFAKGHLSSNRTGGNGLDDVYEWEYMVKPFRIIGTVTNQKGELVENAVLVYSGPDGSKQTITTGMDGKYNITAERNSQYSATIDHKDYFNDYFNLLATADDFTEFIVKDIVLEDFPRFKIRPVNEDGTPIDGMNVKIICDNKPSFEGLSTLEGIFWEFPHTYHRGDSVTLTIDFSKKGYLNKSVTFKVVIENGGDIVIPKEQFVFVKAEEKLEISKLIDLKPIYYDFAKWDIRADAATELDKVVKFLNENPSIQVELSSHTDCRGSDSENLKLSDKRAKSAADYIKKGITNPSQIYGKGYGETKTIHKDCAKCTEEQHAENRRTEFTIVKVN